MRLVRFERAQWAQVVDVQKWDEMYVNADSVLTVDEDQGVTRIIVAAPATNMLFVDQSLAEVVRVVSR